MATSIVSTSSKMNKQKRRKKKKSAPDPESNKGEDADMNYMGEWKVADVNYSALKLDELHEFMGIEELSVEHDVIKGTSRRRRGALGPSQTEQVSSKRKTSPGKTQQASPLKKLRTQNQSRPTENENTASSEGQAKAEVISTTAQKRKMQFHENKGPTGNKGPIGNKDEIARGAKRRKKDGGKKDEKNKTGSQKASSFTKGIPVPKQHNSINMSAWKHLPIPKPVLNALQDLGFKEPTPIQKSSIPAAIKDNKDIVGAAETGSGKTLAFGIPVIHIILQQQGKLQKEARSKTFKEADSKSLPAKPKPTTISKDSEAEKKKEISSKEELTTSELSKKDGKTSSKAETKNKSVKGTKKTGSGDDGVDFVDDSDYDFDEDGDHIDYDLDDDDGNEEFEESDENEDIDNDYDDDSDFDDEENSEDENLDNKDESDDGESSDFDDDSDADSDDNDFDDKDKADRAGVKAKRKPKTTNRDEEPSPDKLPKRPRGKKQTKKKKFRIRERKMLDLDGRQLEGVELINKTGRSGLGCVRAIDDISDAELLAHVGLGQMVEQINETESGNRDNRPLFALILTPTRELAVQVKNHLVAVAKYTDIKVAVIVGGMSAQKQERVLKKKPEIIVGTPGRVWELFREGEPHLATMAGVRCLVLDEADRMVEKGHYEQLTEILQQLNSSPTSVDRQTFVFSATLTLVHQGSDRKTLANKGANKFDPKQEKKNKKEKLGSLIKKVGIRDNPVVVDLTQKQGTVASLMEAKIVCDVTDKDIYLYYFLLQFPGRTLVFCNSIDCIRRLCSILTLLACNPLPLHSSMHQKQRLKNMDRFASNPKALLLATDVAARGLDIPDIEHVIHYQVPRTSETYIHRSGRTARQAKEGISIMFVSPSETNSYRRVCRTLQRDDIQSFPVDHMYFNAVRERVGLARHIDQTNHRLEKKKHANDWFIRAAKELDVDLDEDLVLHDLGDSHERGQHDKKVQFMKDDLKSLLKRVIFPRGSSWLYPTLAGKLASPLSQGSPSSAVSVVKRKVGVTKVQTPTAPPKKAKKSKNKFK